MRATTEAKNHRYETFPALVEAIDDDLPAAKKSSPPVGANRKISGLL